MYRKRKLVLGAKRIKQILISIIHCSSLHLRLPAITHFLEPWPPWFFFSIIDLYSCTSHHFAMATAPSGAGGQGKPRQAVEVPPCRLLFIQSICSEALHVVSARDIPARSLRGGHRLPHHCVLREVISSNFLCYPLCTLAYFVEGTCFVT